MYEDPKRWSFFFNLKVLLTLSSWVKSKSHNAPPSSPLDQNNQSTIFERSPLACRHVFSEVQHERGELSDKEMRLLVEAHGALGWEPDVVLYLAASPEVCDAHMRTRDRASERGVSIEYIREVHAKYERLFGAGRDPTLAHCRVIVVDASTCTPSELASTVAEILLHVDDLFTATSARNNHGH